MAKRNYSDDWPERSRAIRQQFGGRCLRCGKRSAHVHHLYYSFSLLGVPLWRVYGREIGGWSAIPVCADCHGWLHRDSNWRGFRRKDLRRNRYATIWWYRAKAVCVLYWWLVLPAIAALLLSLS